MLDSKLKQLAEKMGWTDEDVIEFIEEVKNRLNSHNEQHEEVSSKENMLKNEIFFLLKDLGFVFNKKGSEYLMVAIEEVIKDPSIVYNFNKYFYPKLSKLYGATASSINRNMRYAISKAFSEKGNESVWRKYFVLNREPTLLEFITGIAGFIQMGGD